MKVLSKIRSVITVLFLSVFSFVVPGYGQQEDVVMPTTLEPTPKRLADEMYFDAIKAHIMDDDKLCDSLLLEFIKKDPTQPAAYYQLALNSIKHKSLEKATEYIKKAVALDGKSKWYRSEYAEILAYSLKYSDAADIYMQLAKEEAQNEDYLSKASSYYQNEGKYKQALAALDILLERTGNDEEVLEQKEQVYLKMYDFDAAAKVLQQLIAMNPKESRYYFSLGSIYDNRKQNEKATEVYNKAQELFPGDPNIQYALAQHYKSLNDTAKYNEYVVKAITNPNLDVESQLVLLEGYVHDNQDNTDTGRKWQIIGLFKALAEQHPKNMLTQRAYGDVLMLDGQREKGLEQYKKGIAVDPSSLLLWDRLLSSYVEPRFADSLIYYSEKAMRLFPNQALVQYMNGIGHFNKKNYTKAINAINRAIDLQPEEDKEGLAGMYSMIGDIYYTTKQYTESDTAYERSLRLNSKNPSVLNNYSYYLAERGVRLEEAEKMSKKALELRPTEPTFCDTYGWVLYKMGKYDKAKEWIQRAINGDLEHADATLFEHLGDVYFKLKDVDKAVDYWKAAKERGSENPQIDKKIQDRTIYE
ncbi:MAG: tetratricopeptide repeat protein [Bacteroidota bacterium]